MKKAFQSAAQAASKASGSPWAFMCAFTVVLIWAISGPMFNFSDTWQLVINTSTTIVTFLMVFLIQNTQNRDTVALHAKVDELIIKLDGADNALVTAEDMTDDELEELMKNEKKLASELPSSGEAAQAKAEAAHAADHVEDEFQRRRGNGPTSRAHRRAPGTSSNHNHA